MGRSQVALGGDVEEERKANWDASVFARRPRPALIAGAEGDSMTRFDGYKNGVSNWRRNNRSNLSSPSLVLLLCLSSLHNNISSFNKYIQITTNIHTKHVEVVNVELI